MPAKKTLTIEQLKSQAQAHLNKGDLGAFLFLYQQIILKTPKDPNVYSDLGVIFSRRWDFEKAEGYFMKALSLEPNNLAVLNNYANCLQKQGRLEEAIEACDKVLAQNPNALGTLLNKAIAHRKLGEFEVTIELCERLLQHKPDHPDAHFNIGFSKLFLGKWEEAWPEYEWRWKMSETAAAPPSKDKAWEGQPLNGKTILVFNEQGFGDNIQMARFVDTLHKQKAKVLIKTRPELVRLMKHVKGISEVYDQLPSPDAYDYQTPIFSLPYHLKISPDALPNKTPYFNLGPPDIKMSPSSTKKLKVGLVWSTSQTNLITKTKSINLEQLLPLLRLQGIQYYSLQMDEQKNEIYQADFINRLIDLSPYIKDFYDTAQFISQLDLVISVDTAAAHLAGALNKPAWVLLPSVPDWRWQGNTEKSKWYPSLRLFRQTVRYEWDDPIDQVRKELEKKVDGMIS